MTEKVWRIALGVLMTGAGLAHFILTRGYLPIVPTFFPQRMGIIVVSGVVEFAAGIGLFFPGMRREAGLVVLILMVGFLPLHAWDLFRERPAIGPHWVTVIRFALQFLLIYWAWKVWRVEAKKIRPPLPCR